MRFGVLGPLRVCTDAGADVVVRSRHERTVLSVLLVRTGQVVTVDNLVQALWPDRPPASHASNLQTYVSRLRERLPGVAIDNLNGGYRLQVDAGDVDVLVFRRAVAAARAALVAGDPAEAAAQFRHGLAQWRGRPFADLSVPLLEPDIAQWEVERLGAVEDCVDAELAAGDDISAVLAELHRLVAEHPLRERLHGQLMVALCRAGRRADALAAYQNARNALVAELGIEPGQQLRRLHQAILRGEEPAGPARPGRAAHQVAPAQAAATAVRAPFPVCQLPPALPGFVGRAQTIGRLAELLEPATAAVPVIAVSGQPGVGKSALAVVAAHRMRAAFPDGQLFIHLAGASPAPREPAGVLADLLRALGMPGSAIPQDLSALSSAYRAKLADRRVLIVLDDAASPAQVRPLVPGTPGSAVLVTSRRRLSGLIDAWHVPVDPLTAAETQALLAHIVGAGRVAEEPEHAARIGAACGNLPLALRIAGTRLATRPWRLRTLADRLDDERQRLNELAIGDQQVRASLALSVQALSPPAREAFGLLGLLGPVSFAGWAVAALLDRPEVEPVIDELVEASLVEPVHPDGSAEPRYRLHDLLRVYAEELNAVGDPGRSAAPRRLLSAAAALAGTAARGLPRTLTWAGPWSGLWSDARSGPACPPAVPPADDPPGAVAGARARVAADPAGWFAAERGFLIGTVNLAHRVGADRDTLDMVERLAPFLWVHGHWEDLHTVQRLARDAAERTGDARSSARVEFISGVLRLVRGEVAGAAERFARARARFERLGDRHGLACLLTDQAVLYGYQDRGVAAVRTARRAVALFRAEGDRLGAILASPGLSAALRGTDRLTEALEVDRTAVAEARQLGAAEIVLARCLNALAVTRLLRGEAALAYGAASVAANLLRTVNDRYVLVAALRHLASAAACLGRRQEAVQLLQESHDLAVELGDRLWATGLERDLAVSWIGDGRADAAVGVLQRCLRTFEEMDIRSAQAATLGMLARAYDAIGADTAARDARSGARILTDPRDTRTLTLAGIVLRLAEPPEHPPATRPEERPPRTRRGERRAPVRPGGQGRSGKTVVPRR